MPANAQGEKVLTAHVDEKIQLTRSALMARIGPRDTRPELLVRSLVHRLGFRFRLHRRDLPGTPDLVFSSRRKVIFVHGCFWHRHAGCKKASSPKTRVEFWQEKFAKNVERDARKELELARRGWDVLTVWECETRDAGLLSQRLEGWLSKTPT